MEEYIINKSDIKNQIEKYYTNKIITHGATPAGVDWNCIESQNKRFDQLVKVFDKNGKIILNEIGCGYGALVNYLIENKYDFEYFGYDLSLKMIEEANKLFGSNPRCNFFHGDSFQLKNYTLASGIFNVKNEINVKTWERFVKDILFDMNNFSKKGFCFNILTKYSDREYMKDYLYYGDPCYYFDFCKKEFSKNVALLHDYDLYEFTIIVRK